MPIRTFKMCRPHSLLLAIVLCVGCTKPQVWRYEGTLEFWDEDEKSRKNMFAVYELCARSQEKTDIFGTQTSGPNKALVWELDDQCSADVMDMFGESGFDCALSRVEIDPPEPCTGAGTITGSIEPLE